MGWSLILLWEWVRLGMELFGWGAAVCFIVGQLKEDKTVKRGNELYCLVFRAAQDGTKKGIEEKMTEINKEVAHSIPKGN